MVEPSSPERPPPDRAEASFSVVAPKIEAPKGGGAVRGIGEKFAANPVTGTGSMSVPVAASPGRAGFGPQLALSYDSGAGNGPFGLGWSLSLPEITRKTDRGLPRYRDAEDSDTFVLSGAEDLVPLLVEGPGGWVRHRDPDGHPGYVVERYRPRVEGLFARIERWTATSGEVHWRSVTRENVTTVYGRTAESRIADPADPSRVFSWLICQSYDDKGNAMVVEYRREDSRGVDATAVQERHRTEDSRAVNLYPARIRYGNRRSNLDDGRPGDPAGIDDWMFELVFDYGEGRAQELEPAERRPDRVRARLDPDGSAPWPVRPDPFSSYRSGFEVRTYRRCERILMVHHFPDQLGVADYLVRSTDFDYADLPFDPDPSVEAELAHQGSTRYDSVLRAARHSSYVREPDGSYLREATPPLELDYSQPVVSDVVTVADPETLEDLPRGLDGDRYRWVDLDGEGTSGVLTEQDGAWYYKRNLSPLATAAVDGDRQPRLRLAPAEVVKRQPSLAAVAAGGHQFVDLAGDGQLDVASFAPPVPGFSERTADRGWAPFVPFESVPNLPWAAGGQLKLVDLTGDGHADVLRVDDDIVTWYPSLGESGFGPAEQVQPPVDGPFGPSGPSGAPAHRLVLGHQTDSIYFADLSGDGLSDLVRIRNGEVCYWPNLGYGRFGAEVTMGNSPWFDHPDQFDQRRIRLADIDGSGVTDILYLGADGVRVYFNQSGNAWSDPRRLRSFPPIDELTSVVAVDLLGNGTACLVWSSPLPGDARRPLRYLDLMGGQRGDLVGQKPHLLVRVRNNLGATTEIEYAPSTKFYLEDAHAGRPWRTRLPFPVHCVERVTVTDKWQRTSFSTRYSYHHGYFDGAEREFRGFGRVDQIDVEDYGRFAAGNPDSPYVTDDRRLYQPPVKTVRWFHTGEPSEGAALLRQYADEYFPSSLGEFAERDLPPPDLGPGDLDARERREAMRACKGTALRVETYELDVDALQEGEHRPVRLFTVAQHNRHIRRLQPRLDHPHAVFLVTESEAVTYHHDLDLTDPEARQDPRVTHSLNLTLDEHGNVLQAVTVGYPRLGHHEDPDLPEATVVAISEVQHERHVAQVETRMTADIDTVDTYRLRVPCEVVTSEITGIEPADGRYFTIDELRNYQLSERHQPAGREVVPIPYHRLPTRSRPERRIVEHVRTLFFAEDLATPLPLGRHGRLGLTYEAYKLALTDELLAAVIGPERLTPDVVAGLADAAVSGYLTRTDLAARFPDRPPGEYWIRSGVAWFSARHFYLPDRYTDPFDNPTRLSYNEPDILYIEQSIDSNANHTRVVGFDHRVLAPSEVEDLNGNRTEIAFDVLGRAVAVAVKGKGSEGDHLDRFDDALRYLDPGARAGFFTGDYDKAESVRLLGTATTRHVYSFGAVREDGGAWRYEQHCPAAASLRRTRHVADDRPSDGVDVVDVLVAFAYSSGTGETLLTKSQAEPAEDDPAGSLRWIVSGKTVVNNKGKPVKQYEPYFTDHHRYEEPVEQGVTPLIFYDAVGRVVQTEHPDGTVSQVEITPWHTVGHDQLDTVEPGNRWCEAMTGPAATPEGLRAAEQSLDHAGTPSLTFLDTLGREVVAVAHNRTLVHREDGTTELVNERYPTITKLDAEGKPLWIRDVRGNLVMQYIAPPVANNSAADPVSGYSPTYDIAGNLLFQHSMDAGDRWMVPDATGQPLFAWDVNDVADAGGGRRPQHRRYRTVYDALRRPVEQRLQLDDVPDWLVIEKLSYGDDPDDAHLGRDVNARGQVVAHWDSSGLLRNTRFDFKGNIVESTRQLAAAFEEEVVDWSEGSPTGRLEDEEFRRLTEFDALDRMRRMVNWHSDPDHVAVYEPAYDERGLLRSESLTIGARLVRTAGGWTTPGGETTPATAELRYNARGQRVTLAAGNGMRTEYEYDEETFRLRMVRTVAPGVRSEIEGLRSHLVRSDVVQDLRYTYDAAGNVTEIRDEAFKEVIFDGQEASPHSRYRYDAIGRLIEAYGRESASYAWPLPTRGRRPETGLSAPTTNETLRPYAERFIYDSVGNIDQMRHITRDGDWTRTYSYAADSNRLASTQVGRSGQPVEYLHDAHGNMLNLNNTDEQFHLTWDHNDMIRSVDLGGGGVAYYTYQSDKQRTRKVITSRDGSPAWERIYLEGFELYRRYSGTGREAAVVESHHLFAGDQRLLLVEDVRADDRGGPRILYRYQVNDHLGSSCMELNQDRAIIAYETYHPYGTSAFHAHDGSTEVNTRRYRYTGMERDIETGLSYHTARYYTLWLGRWCSADPQGVVEGPNLYEYVLSNPVLGSDTSGRTPQIVTTAEDEAARMSIPPGERAYSDVGGLSEPNVPQSLQTDGPDDDFQPRWEPPGSRAEISEASPSAYANRWTPEENQIHREAAELGYYTDYHFERLDALDLDRRVDEGEGGGLPVGQRSAGARARASTGRSSRERRFREDVQVFREIRENAERAINTPELQRYIALRADAQGVSFPLAAGQVYHELVTLRFYNALDRGRLNYAWEAAMTRDLRERGGADFRVRVQGRDWRTVEFTTVGQSQGHALRERARIYDVNRRGESIHATVRVTYTYDPHMARRVPGGQRVSNPPMPSPSDVQQQLYTAQRQYRRALRTARRASRRRAR